MRNRLSHEDSDPDKPGLKGITKEIIINRQVGSEEGLVESEESKPPISIWILMAPFYPVYHFYINLRN